MDALTELIDNRITQDLLAESSTQKRYPLRPSSAGKCKRALAYELAEYYGYESFDKEQLAPNVMRLLRLGDKVEQAVIEDLKKLSPSGIHVDLAQQNVIVFKLISGRLIRGSIDLTLSDQDTGEILLIDVKSAKDSFSRIFKTRWEQDLEFFRESEDLREFGKDAFYVEDLESFCEQLGDNFLIDNLLQLNCYMGSHFLREIGVKEASVFKYNKNDSRIYELRFKFSPNLFKEVEEKFNEVEQTFFQTKSAEAVDRGFMLGSIRCSFCPYSSQCWGQDASKAFVKSKGHKQWPVDTHKLEAPLSQWIEESFEARSKLEKLSKEKERLDQAIVEAMEKNGLKKIRLSNDKIYQLKYLKSPRPHFEIRQGKL